jgi:Leucine-rich repeat (LRR) protein
MSIKILAAIVLVSFCCLRGVESVTCSFEMVGEVYSCLIRNQNINSEDDMQEIAGDHLFGRSNSDVRQLISSRSTIVVFPSLVIDRFVNLEIATLAVASMTTIQRPITNCANLWFVMLDSNLITSIPGGIFQNCGKITFLSFSSNRISEIHDNAFAGLSSLTTLALMHNRIPSINRNMLTPIPSLTTLAIGFNEIKNIEPSVLAVLPQLRHLDLVWNDFKTWNNDILQNNQQIEQLFLQGNLFESVDVNSFANLQNLKTLSVGAALTELPAGWNLRTVEELILDTNLFTTINTAPFTNMPSLKTLRFNRNRLVTFDFSVGTPRALEGLETLMMQNNNITALPAGSFTSLANLKRLNLASNRLQRLNADAILVMMPLEILDVTNNVISEMDREIFSNVQNLDFRARNNRCTNRNIMFSPGSGKQELQSCFSSGTMMKVNIFVVVAAIVFVIKS